MTSSGRALERCPPSGPAMGAALLDSWAAQGNGPASVTAVRENERRQPLRVCADESADTTGAAPVTDDPDLFEQAEAEYRELDKELVVPAYRRFCEEFELPFHFWDGLPKADFDAEIASNEMSLHKEAMDLFNRLKPELVFFKGNVVWYQLRSWDGAFTYSKVALSDFLEEAADELFFAKQLQARLDVVSSVLRTLAGVGLFVVLILSARLLPRTIPWQVPLVGAAACGTALAWWLGTRIRDVPRRILDDGRLVGVASRVDRLRKELLRIRGSRPDPLVRQREVRLGAVLLEEMRQILTEDELRRLLRRMRSGLRVVPPPEN